MKIFWWIMAAVVVAGLAWLLWPTDSIEPEQTEDRLAYIRSLYQQDQQYLVVVDYWPAPTEPDHLKLNRRVEINWPADQSIKIEEFEQILAEPAGLWAETVFTIRLVDETVVMIKPFVVPDR